MQPIQIQKKQELTKKTTKQNQKTESRPLILIPSKSKMKKEGRIQFVQVQEYPKRNTKVIRANTGWAQGIEIKDFKAQASYLRGG